LYGKVEQLSEQYAEKERNLRKSLMALQRLQERYPRCSWTVDQLTQAKQQMITIEEKWEDFRFHKHMAH
jgi:hypothetical protein